MHWIPLFHFLSGVVLFHGCLEHCPTPIDLFDLFSMDSIRKSFPTLEPLLQCRWLLTTNKDETDLDWNLRIGERKCLNGIQWSTLNGYTALDVGFKSLLWVYTFNFMFHHIIFVLIISVLLELYIVSENSLLSMWTMNVNPWQEITLPVCFVPIKLFAINWDSLFKVN